MSPESVKRGELTRHLLDVACAKARELGLDTDADLLVSVIVLAMHLAVDRTGGNVAHGVQDIVAVVDFLAEQMQAWPLEDRLLDRGTVN